MTKHYKQDIPDLRQALSELHDMGMSLAAIGEVVGVDGDSVGRYIAGTRTRIGFETGWRIMRLYHERVR